MGRNPHSWPAPLVRGQMDYGSPSSSSSPGLSPWSLWTEVSHESPAPEERPGLTADVLILFVSLVSWGHLS